MTQLPFPETIPADTSSSSPTESETEKMLPTEKEAYSPLSYLPSGPHGRMRAELAWVNKLLAYDQNNSVSAISLRELRRALSAFQAEVRVSALGQGVPAGYLAGAMPSRSSTRTNRRSTISVKNRTRNFKS